MNIDFSDKIPYDKKELDKNFEIKFKKREI